MIYTRPIKRFGFDSELWYDVFFVFIMFAIYRFWRSEMYTHELLWNVRSGEKKKNYYTRGLRRGRFRYWKKSLFVNAKHYNVTYRVGVWTILFTGAYNTITTTWKVYVWFAISIARPFSRDDSRFVHMIIHRRDVETRRTRRNSIRNITMWPRRIAVVHDDHEKSRGFLVFFFFIRVGVSSDV